MLDIRLLGPPRFTLDGRPVDLSAGKARALLCYLAATRQVHSRDRLAGFFWPEVPERNALASLRTALYDVRRALGPASGEYLFVERTRVAFRTESAYHLDVAALERLGPDEGGPDLATVQAAVDAYGGDFLAGLSLPDAYDFDDWVFLERERLTHLYLGALCRLGRSRAAAGDYERAGEAARRVLAVDPLREDVHRSLMRYYTLGGQRAAALTQYRTCADLLERELGIEPLAATARLHQRILDEAPLDDEADGPTPVARAAGRLSLPVADPLAGADGGVALVGRQAELEALAGAWRRAVEGVGGVVVVSGEAGIGKTRLVAELARRVEADGAAVLVGRSYESAASQPYGPIVDALRRSLPGLDLDSLGLPDVWLRELARLLPELEALLPAGANAPLDGVRDRDRLFEAVRAFVGALGAQRPVLFVLEDVQWADETSLSLVGTIARNASVQRLLLVVTAREEEVGAERRAVVRGLAAHGAALGLPPLTADEAAGLVAALSGAEAAPEQFGRRLHRATGGNPFFLVETLRQLFDQGSLADGGAGWTTTSGVREGDYAALPVPASVGLIVDGRLDRLGDDARSLVDCAAVLRRDFAFDVVQVASGLPAPAALDALDALIRLGVVRETDGAPEAGAPRYDFAHALVRDRVYGSLTGARRQYLHRQVAGLLESEAPAGPERLAYHYTRGGVRDRACAWSLRAGDAALGVYAGEDALAQYRAALELAVAPEESYRALAGMGDAGVSLGRPGEAIGHYEAALAHAPGSEARSELHRRIGRAHERRGVYDLALDAYAAAGEALRGLPMSLSSVRLADGLATVYVRLGRHAEAAALCHEALVWLAAKPEVPQAREAEAWVRNTLGMAHMHGGDYPRALQSLEESLAVKRALADRLGEATLLNNIGVVHYHCGDDARARDYYTASLAIKEDIGDGYGRSIALTNLALIETHLGEYDEAARHLDAARAGAGDVGASWLMPEIERVRAQRALALGDAGAALAAGRAALAAAEELGVPAFIGVAHRVLGLVKGAGLGDHQAAGEHFETSLAVFEMLENAHELAKTHAAYGEALAAGGRAGDAHPHLRAALETFRRSGAHGRSSRLEPLVGD